MFIDSFLNSLSSVYGNKVAVITVLIFLTIASYTDIKSMKIPNKVNILFLLSRFLIISFLPLTLSSLAGGLLAFVVPLIPAIVLMHKMGGDIKCLTVLGLFVGGYNTILMLALSSMYGLIYIILFNKKGNISFAPFFLISHITLMLLAFLI